MAKVNGLAAQLAQELAQEGAQQGAQAGKKSVAGGGGATGTWRLSELGQDFDLDAAMTQALGRATRHLNHSLAGEGLVVRLPQEGPESSDAGQVEVAEKETSRVLRTYDVPDFLRFYAAREKTTGVIINGQV